MRSDSSGAWPESLGPLLDEAARRRPELEIYILSWDFSMIYAMERELFPRYRLRWKSHDRVHFCLDGEHPLGASQHQKLVVIDGQVAFSGGLDLSKWRWDTPAHLVDDERRIDPSGAPYPPFHDVQMVVDGEAAHALAEIARQRWVFAAGREPNVDAAEDSDPWPQSIEPDVADVEVGIARTFPASERREQVREVEQLYLDSIAAARRFIYAENQYLSSHRVGHALRERLQEPDGPEVVIVTPEKTGGWLEQHTMDVLRARLLTDLREADRHGRLRVYSVRLSKDPPVSLMIHAKVMIVDDTFVRVASSNLSNRSMGLDSECDLAIESSSSRDRRKVIAHFRRRLLSEHLGVSIDSLTKAEESHASLIAAIESLRGAERSLEPLRAELPEDMDAWVPDAALLDPEKPVKPDDLLDYFVSPSERKPLRRHLLKLGVLLVVLFAVVAAWRWTPLSNWIALDAVVAGGRWLDSQPFTPALVLAAFLIVGSAGVPITLVVVATVIVFGPWLGAVYSLAGSVLSALGSFGVGRLVGREAIGRVVGSRVNQLSRKLADRGVWSTIVVRIVPVAPFAVVNVIAGVSKIRLRDFAVGTLLGMIPGVLVISILTDRVIASLREPNTWTAVAVVAIAGLAAGTLFGVRHLLRSRAQ